MGARTDLLMRPCETHGRFNPFICELLNMEPRIRLYPLHGDVSRDCGFIVRPDHIFIPWAQPAVEHEIAHLVELTASRRWTMTDWGMPRFEVGDIFAPRFFAALARETRVRALQRYMMTFKNEQELHDSWVWNQCNNPYWAEMVRRSLPFGRFRDYQDVQMWIRDLHEKVYKSWSQDRIRHEWMIRLDHFRNWMETSHDEDHPATVVAD